MDEEIESDEAEDDGNVDKELMAEAIVTGYVLRYCQL